MKVLLVTGRHERERVERLVRGREGCDVVSVPVEVASLMTPRMVVEGLKGRHADLLLVPGLMKGDLGRVEKELGIPTYKGPKDLSSLPYLLDNIEGIKLSKSEPACELMRKELKEAAMRELEIAKSERYKKEKLKCPWNLLIGGLPVGRDFPIRVVAEIVDADEKADEEVLSEANHCLSSGADIIDIGVRKEDPERVGELVGLLAGLKAPLGIDTLERGNIAAAIEHGADLIMSFDRPLISEFRDVKTPAVIIPKDGEVPAGVEDRIELLEGNLELARERGFEKLIADPILNPLNQGFVDSLTAYRVFGRRHELPMLMGTGNVTELIDADSVGINALLCGAAMECGASLVFSPEASDKTRGSVGELAAAAKMMYLARLRGSPPKDLGAELFRFKEKVVRRDELGKEVLSAAKVVNARGRRGRPRKDSYFKIFLDEKITVMHFLGGKLCLIIQGKTAEELSQEIAYLGLVKDPSEALYLGRELEKAETALKTGRSYIQDAEVF